MNHTIAVGAHPLWLGVWDPSARVQVMEDGWRALRDDERARCVSDGPEAAVREPVPLGDLPSRQGSLVTVLRLVQNPLIEVPGFGHFLNAVRLGELGSQQRLGLRQLRPSLSNLHATTTSNFLRFASATIWSSAGRRSFAPDTPRSTYSTAVHPLASM